MMRDRMPHSETTLEQIRAALFAWLGIEERKRKESPGGDETATMARAGFPGYRISREVGEAWARAGYPDLQEFLRQRKGK